MIIKWKKKNIGINSKYNLKQKHNPKINMYTQKNININTKANKT